MAVQLRPNQVDYRYALALALREAGDYGGAIEEFRRVIRLRPDYVAAHAELAAAYLSISDHPAAISEYHEAVRLKPGDAALHEALGLVLRKTGDLPESNRELRRAVELSPNEAGYHRNLAEALQSAGDIAGFVQEYREEVRLRPDDADAHAHLANAYQAANDLAKSLGGISRGGGTSAAEPGISFPHRAGAGGAGEASRSSNPTEQAVQLRRGICRGAGGVGGRAGPTEEFCLGRSHLPRCPALASERPRPPRQFGGRVTGQW